MPDDTLDHIELGARIDDRPDAEKERDFRFEEMVASAEPVNWQEKDEDDWRRFPIFSQNGSGSCVAQTLAKLLGINYMLRNKEFVPFSPTHIYQRRVNKPSGGMIANDAFEIARRGVTLEVLAPSWEMTDAEMDGFEIKPYVEDVGEIFTLDNYVALPTKDIDTVASTIQKTGKGVMVWFYFKSNEWKRDVPEVRYEDLERGASSTARHSVTAVDFFMYKGKKALLIEDSWGNDTGMKGQRIITEDFFKARNWYAAYALEFKYQKPQTPSKYHFDTPLEFTTTVTYTVEVKKLQKFLRDLGHFPTNIADENLGYYGAITAAAVRDWQVSNWEKFYALDRQWTRETLSALGGKYFGNVSIQVANQMS